MPTRRRLHDATIAAGYLLGAAVLWRGLPGEIPPSWRMSDGGVIWLGAPMAALLLPTASAVTAALLRGLCRTSTPGLSDEDDALTICDAMLLRFGVFLLALHATVLAGLLGWLSGREWSAQLVPIMLGLLLISIGNLLPRTRPNLAIGIRTSRTLSNRASWRNIHRPAGYITVVVGCTVVLAALAAPPPLGTRMILAVAPIGAAGIAVVAMREARRRAV